MKIILFSLSLYAEKKCIFSYTEINHMTTTTCLKCVRWYFAQCCCFTEKMSINISADGSSSFGVLPDLLFDFALCTCVFPSSFCSHKLCQWIIMLFYFMFTAILTTYGFIQTVFSASGKSTLIRIIIFHLVVSTLVMPF